MSCFLTITMNNILVFTKDIKLGTIFRKNIQTDNLPAGTAFVTLYDQELNPLAERLIFLNGYKKLNVEIGVSSPKRGEERELTVNTTDDFGNNVSSIVSVAVIDSASGFNTGIPMPEIESEYLYDKEFYNDLPLKIRSVGLRNMDSKSVDVLLMTFGWRKFIPKAVARDIIDKEPVNYDLLKIINPGDEKKGRSVIKVVSLEGLDSISLLTDKNREAVLFFDSLDAGARQIMIIPDKNPVRNINPVRVQFPENKGFMDKAKLMAIFPRYTNEDSDEINIRQPSSPPDTLITIGAVTIKAPNQPTGAEEEKYAKIYQSTATTTMESKDFDSGSTFEDILFKYNPYYLDKRGKTIYLRDASYNMTGPSPALIVLDNTAIDTTYDLISALPASRIKSVTFLRGTQGFAMFGFKAIGGVVFVTTKKAGEVTDERPDFNKVRRNDDLFKQVRLFRTDIEYYIPTKEQVTYLSEYQLRPTILWKADVYIDDSGPVRIKYPDNIVKGTALVFVNGISLTNMVGSGSCSYK